MRKFTFTRSAIIEETYVIEAESEQAARDRLDSGYESVTLGTFVDWYSDEFVLERVVEDTPLTSIQ